MLETVDAEHAGFDPQRWARALEYADALCRSRQIGALTLMAGRHGRTPGPQGFGHCRLTLDSPALPENPIFLIASITKPIVALGFLLLIERGQVALSDRVIDYLPDFGKNGKSGIRIRHLLTHTSGLPDMLDNNQALREAHSELDAFVAGTMQVRPDFPPGRGVQYQSMGFAILAAILQVIDGRTCRQFLREELFEPLGMQDTALGAPDDWFDGSAARVDRIPEIRVPEVQRDADWGWNTRYWRQLGSPWGGLLTTATDLSRIAQMMLNRGRWDDRQVLSPATVAAATRNQLQPMKDVPETERRCRPWGLGWRLQWPDHSANFGDLLGSNSYGHWGATGTVMWIDPDTSAFCVILSTEPQEPHGRQLARLSNLVAASLDADHSPVQS